MEAQSHNQAYTILRIKRKRTDEPLDALVVESRVRRKKSRGGVDVFQFAQTVEHDAWEDQQLRQTLQSQISKLTQDSSESTRGPLSPVQESKPPGAPPHVPRVDDGGRRYTVKVAGEERRADPRRRPTSPPKVISAKDIPQNDFKMYDAVLAEQGPSLPALDTEMEKFLPMLQDYLTLQDATSSGSVPLSSSTSVEDASTSNDYVWDVFYRRPYSLAEWNSVAANVGTVTGLPPSALDDLSDDSESEEEDEADEDSNAEEYYKNDYPEEEGSDSDDSGSKIAHIQSQPHLTISVDMFHENSENDDFASDPGNDSDHAWR
ncbi:hypothetical protein HYDPIDRAFT_32410 [Hydnomerulius pinastri MD-312]|uniref:Probable RNA polymerase II nuclear localization protein SLC7A6OS n=1 Tax=Hydnomerulius pinastri MD-312 TaxID=994086 RepID=A0A0C9VR74_9AGAM|nr:hypothetical protein HYDPIDRAFT_32410 [Hydnomerulius pinastri MD-312]